MQLATTRFGTLEIDPDTIFTFTQPIIGFQDYRRFVLVPGPKDSALRWLQSVDSGELAFILMDPRTVVPDYQVQLGRSDLSELAVASVDELEVYTLVVVPHDQTKVRTNLKAPVLINPKQRLGKQTILERSNHPIQFFLAKEQRDQPQAQEVTSARSDA
jgi:flagellar assembly factor FliW